MHGLICKSLESFILDRHGPDVWAILVERTNLPFEHFEMLATYDDALAAHLVQQAAKTLETNPFHLVEDLGHWLCTHPPMEPFRRLIRFMGGTFVDVIYSLGEVRDRAAMSLPGFDTPAIILTEHGPGEFTVRTVWSTPGACALVRGILRAMADDYGALATFDDIKHRHKNRKWDESFQMQVFENTFHEPRPFDLGARA